MEKKENCRFLDLFESKFPDWALFYKTEIQGNPKRTAFLASKGKNEEKRQYFVVENNLQIQNGSLTFQEIFQIQSLLGDLKQKKVLEGDSCQVFLANIDDKLDFLPYTLNFSAI